MYLCHPAHPPAKLSRTGDISWTLEDVVFTKGPFQDANITDTTLTPSSASTGSRTITASAVTGINGGSGFLSTDVGRFIYFNSGYGKITAVGSTTSITVDVTIAYANANAITAWQLGSFSNTTGFPACVTFLNKD